METLTVLIIEDEEAHFSLMKRAIAREFPCASVFHFQEANTCLERLDQINPTVIITDYLMPGMNGIEFLELLNQQDIDVPVIMITGQGDENIAVRAMKSGAKDYLVKFGDFFNLLPSVIEKVVRQRELKQSLHTSERRFQDLAESTFNWLWEMDVQGKYIYSNHVVEALLGYHSDEVIGKYFYDFFSNQDKKVLKDRVFQIIGEVKPIRLFEAIFVRKDEFEIIMEINGVPFFDNKGKLLGYRCISQDISERKRDEIRIRNLSQQLLNAQESERQMISYELHDRVAQDLSVSKIECDMFLKHQPALQSKVKEKLLGISNSLQGAISSIRDLSYDLRPPVLTDMGIAEALKIYCEEFSIKNGMKIDFQSSGLQSFNLDPNTEIHIYRLVQEGLHNIRKHADAAQVNIMLMGAFPNIILHIEDNGKGFDVKARELALGNEKRMGLQNIKQRVNLLHGQMTIQSRPMQGTKLLIKIPFKRQKSESEKTHINH
ncbi:MAG: response regulator [Deltaproteobacteria bacterium]|nr:response regulator [Deltaproteobacteria bacterium]